jgi:dUTP pyrophosphatase
MKQKIKIKLLNDKCLPTMCSKGDWIDLRAAEDIHINGPYAVARSRKGGEASRKLVIPTRLIPLGIAVEMPKGMEGIVVPRSSSNSSYHIIQSNSVGVIDQVYNGPEDQWYMPILATEDVHILKGERICQFRIQLSQKATIWQKIKWFLSNGVTLIVVEELNNKNREGFGSTGKD